MSLSILHEVILKTMQFIKKGYKDLMTLALYKVILVLGFFIVIHQKFTYEVRISKVILADLDLFTLIEDWQILVYILFAVPILLLINAFTIRTVENQASKHTIRYSLSYFGRYIIAFLTYYFLLFIVFNWLIQALALDSLFLRIFLSIILIPMFVFTVTYLRFIPTKTFLTGSIIRSVKQTYALINEHILSALTLAAVSIGSYVLFEWLIAVLEVNGALIYERMMHLKWFIFILLLILIIIKAIFSYLLYIIDITFILNHRVIEQNNKTSKK